MMTRKKCDLLNNYFSFISKLDEANATLPDIELKTNNNITGINVSVQEISDIIQIIFHKSLQQSKYPTNWKLAHVIAVFKRGNSSLPSHYRPISLISCVGKIMERELYTNMFITISTKINLYMNINRVFFLSIQQYISY